MVKYNYAGLKETTKSIINRKPGRCTFGGIFMKYIRIYIIVITLILPILTSCTVGPPPEITPTKPIEAIHEKTRWDNIVESGELKVGVVSEGDSFESDMINAFAKELNIYVKKIPIDWHLKSDCLSDGEVDLLWGQIPDTAENSMKYELSNPYFSSEIAVVEKSGASGEEGKTGVIVNSAETELAREKRDTEDITVFDNYNAMFNSLKNGQITSVHINKEIYENSKYRSDDYVISGEYAYNLVLAFKQNDKDIKAEVEKILVKIKASNAISEITTKWYGKDLLIN
jgi:ABC-type amino acid transport substrate-binding protein